MSLPLPVLQDRSRAALLGAAIGDALGFPLRGTAPQTGVRTAGLADDFAPRPRGKYGKGQFSAHTQLLMATAESIVRERRVDGRSLATHFGWLFEEGVVLQPTRSISDALERLASGTPWMSAGANIGVKDASVLPRGIALGLWKGEDRRLSHDAGILAVVTHKDPACAAAICAAGRAVALAMSAMPVSPSAFCLELAQAAAPHDVGVSEELRHLPRLLNWEPERAFEALRKIGVPPAELSDERGLVNHVVPSLLITVYTALRFPNDFSEGLSRVLRLGGSVDAPATLLGAILGAQLGTGGIPLRLQRGVMYPDSLQSLADRMVDARFLATSPVMARTNSGERTLVRRRS